MSVSEKKQKNTYKLNSWEKEWWSRVWRKRKRLVRRWIRQRAHIKRFLTSYIKLIWRTSSLFLDILWNYEGMCGSADKKIFEGLLTFHFTLIYFFRFIFIKEKMSQFEILIFSTGGGREMVNGWFREKFELHVTLPFKNLTR